MILRSDTPPSIAELLQSAPPAPRHIALHVTVDGRHGQRTFWMSEGGALYFRRADGRLCRANEPQARRIMKGLELARQSAGFTVRGQVVEANELYIARGLVSRQS